MDVPADVKQAYQRVSVEAAKIANKRIRQEFLSQQYGQSSRFSQGIAALSAAAKATMSQNWNPFVPDSDNGKLGLRIRDLDNLFLTQNVDRDLIEQIVTDSIQAAILKDDVYFMTVLLQDWLTEPELFSWFKQPSYDENVGQYRNRKGQFAKP